MKAAVIGAGSWGTALAQVLATAGHDVSLWARKQEVCDGVNLRHANPRYLTEARLSGRIRATTSHAEACEGAAAVVVVTPSAVMRQTAQAIADYTGSDTPIVICSKGVEEGSGLLPVEVFEAELGGAERLAALSGPNHAEEVVYGMPSGTVIASRSELNARFFQEMFATDAFRTYISEDVCGVEVCAAYKNVIAIAVGASYGLGMGDNTAALLMTRGLAEMSRLVAAVGGLPMTCMGLAGMGDLTVTCMSEHSRNRTFGFRLAQGTTLDQYRAETHMVVEGALACRTLRTLAAMYRVELPICDMVHSIVWEGVDPRTVASALLGRSLKPEFY